MDDPYGTLGVARDASQDAIRRAYRKLAKQHHPDLNPGKPEAEARFKKITAANELLSDPVMRGRFDRGEIDAEGHEPPPRPSYRDYAEGDAGARYGGTDDFADMFGSMFDEARRKGGGRRPGRDELFALTVDFLEAVNGATRRLTLPDERTLDVAIPAGTEGGQVLRLRGQGAEGHGGAGRGDALIEVHVTPHPWFVRDGADIRLDLPVTLAEVVLGGPIEVPTPGGPVRMRIPPHSDNGTKLRLRGRGVPAHGGQPAGDLHATLRVQIGGADAALDAFLKDWTPEHAVDPRQAMETTP
ncbi:J domain-containing protein [Siculibacillus lacustris]|uniref:J domain-containing protein n=1 Tax=Siculibacillus lacustris TaxID=1549641 RepID=A0A4Q9VTW6_9HYPH|nr:DnaJ C-terminal domain-containing protein [Siculibacillus lacustris]TBW38435.1 J domain-containing protein [Siculibacillus lacustris]